MAQVKLSMRTSRYWLEFPMDFDIQKDKDIRYIYTWRQVETRRLFFDAAVDGKVKLERVAQEIIFQLWQECWSGETLLACYFLHVGVQKHSLQGQDK